MSMQVSGLQSTRFVNGGDPSVVPRSRVPTQTS